MVPIMTLIFFIFNHSKIFYIYSLSKCNCNPYGNQETFGYGFDHFASTPLVRLASCLRGYNFSLPHEKRLTHFLQGIVCNESIAFAPRSAIVIEYLNSRAYWAARLSRFLTFVCIRFGILWHVVTKGTA